MVDAVELVYWLGHLELGWRVATTGANTKRDAGYYLSLSVTDLANKIYKLTVEASDSLT